MATRTPSQHATYLEHSPFYAAGYARFGAWLPLAAAERVAADHSTTLAALKREEFLRVSDGRVSLLALVQALGY